MPLLRGRIRFELCLYLVIVLSVALTAGLLLVVISRQINAASEATANQLFAQEAARVEAEMALLFSAPLKGAAMLADQPAAAVPITGDGMDHPARSIIAAVLRHNPDMFSGYVGHADGSFLQIIFTRGEPRILRAQQAPDATAVIVRAISAPAGATGRIERWSFLDAGGAVLGSAMRDDPDYDPRERPWYREGRGRAAADVGQPYAFYSTGTPGITASQRLRDGNGVAGFDLTLARLDSVVRGQSVSPGSGVLLTTRDGRLMAAGKAGWLDGAALPPLADLRQDAGLPGRLLRLDAGEASSSRLVEPAELGAARPAALDGPLIVRRAPLLAGSVGEMRIVVAAPLADFNGSIEVLRDRTLLISALLLVLLLPANHLGARKLSHTLGLLAEEARRIRNWDFGGTPPEHTTIREFVALSDAFRRMKGSLLDRTRRLEATQNQLTRLIEIGIALASKPDSALLMHRILTEAKAMTQADGGTLYIRGEDDKLHFRIMLNDSLRILPGPGELVTDQPPVPLFDAEGKPNHRHVCAHAVHRRESVNIADAYDTTEFDFTGTRVFDAHNRYRSRSMLTIPLIPRGGEVIGAIQLINAVDPRSGEIGAFSMEVQRIAEALASVAATALLNRTLLDDQQQLVVSLLQRTEELRTSEARFRSLAALAPVGIYRVDREGATTYCNDRMVEITGMPPSAVLGRAWIDALHPDDRARVVAEARAAADAAGRFRSEHRYLHADGRVVWVLAESRPELGTDGTPDGRIGMLLDITERKAAERALETLRTNLADALESSEHGIALWDADDRLLICNQRFLAQCRGVATPGLAYEAFLAEAVRRGVVQVDPGQEPTVWLAEQVAHHRRADGVAAQRRLPDGQVVRVTAYPARNGGVLTTAVDVTEQLRTEAQLREAQKLDAVGKLTGGLAHDFNNYLGVIIGNLDMLREVGPGTPGGDAMLEAALAGALRSAELTRSLLAFARRQPLDPRPTEVNRRIETVATLLRRTLGEDVTLRTAPAPDLWTVRIDGAQLDSCIVNLATNARDAMPRGGRVEIATRNRRIEAGAIAAAPDLPAGDYVEIALADTGTGMAPEVAASAFEPFFTTKETGRGTGLGLSMVYGFARQSGGAVTIESRVGSGTTVRLLLPRDHAADMGGVGAAPETLPTALAGAGETVLVVEDNAALRRTAADQLVSLGYRVVEADGGTAALAWIDDPGQRIDLLFTDVLMPGNPDGVELTRLARARRPTLRVLLTTGYPGDRLGELGLAAAGLLAKPYRKLELARAVRAALATPLPVG